MKVWKKVLKKYVSANSTSRLKFASLQTVQLMAAGGGGRNGAGADIMMLMHKMLVNVMLMLTQVHPKLCLPSVLSQVNQGFPSKKEVSSSLFINFLSMKLLMLTMRMISIKICIFIQGIVTSRCLHSEGRNVRRIQSKFLTKADKTKGKKHV